MWGKCDNGKNWWMEGGILVPMESSLGEKNLKKERLAVIGIKSKFHSS